MLVFRHGQLLLPSGPFDLLSSSLEAVIKRLQLYPYEPHDFQHRAEGQQDQSPDEAKQRHRLLLDVNDRSVLSQETPRSCDILSERDEQRRSPGSGQTAGSDLLHLARKSVQQIEYAELLYRFLSLTRQQYFSFLLFIFLEPFFGQHNVDHALVQIQKEIEYQENKEKHEFEGIARALIDLAQRIDQFGVQHVERAASEIIRFVQQRFSTTADGGKHFVRAIFRLLESVPQTMVGIFEHVITVQHSVSEKLGKSIFPQTFYKMGVKALGRDLFLRITLHE